MTLVINTAGTAPGNPAAAVAAAQPVGAAAVQAAVAPATGDAGIFSPKQARLVDTRDGTRVPVGPLTPNTWTSFQVLGEAGIPTTGVSAVAFTVTVFSAQGAGAVRLAPNSGTTGATGEVLQYETGETISNTAMVAVGTDGKVAVRAPSAEQIVIEVQGYYSSGNQVAPGGFVPLANGTSQRVIDTRSGTGIAQGELAVDTTYNVHLRDVAGIPATASAVFANITILDSAGGTGTLGSIKTWPTGNTEPTSRLSYPANETTAIGATIDINAAGDASIKVSGNAGAVGVIIDVQGYYDGRRGDGSFTPAATRVWDGNSGLLAPGTDTTIPIGGVNGLPTSSDDIAAYALNLTVINEQGSLGHIVAWPGVFAAPSTSNVAFAPGEVYPSALALVAPGGSPGSVKIRNNGDKPIKLVVDVQGWYTNAGLLPYPYGSNGAAAGNRQAANMVTRQITDRSAVSWNPTTGNALVTGGLLSLKGINQDLAIGWRHNSINDKRPTLNVGLYESALAVAADDSATMIAADGGSYRFAPKTGGGYTMPPGLYATLTKISDQEYQVRFNDNGLVNVYRTYGSTYALMESRSSAGNVITYSYLGGALDKITDTQGRVVTFDYADPQNVGQPSTITDTSSARSIQLDYGLAGRLDTITDATGVVTRLAYSSTSDLISVTDGRGTITGLGYSTTASGKLTSITYDKGSATASTWTAAYPTATTATFTNPLGNAVTYTYNATKQVTGVSDPLGHATSSTSNAHGDQTSSTSALGFGGTGTYNANNSPLTVTASSGSAGGTGSSTKLEYPTAAAGDPWSNFRATKSTSSTGEQSSYSYDTTSTYISSVTAGDGGSATSRYQGDQYGTTCSAKAGQLCKSTDAKGAVTTYTYDASGYLTKITPPTPLAPTAMTYDAAGRVTTATDGKGQKATYTYDGNDRVTKVNYAASGCTTATCTTYTYDANGNMTTTVDGAGTTTFAFDRQNRPTSKTRSSVTSSLTYDLASNITAASDPTGTTTYRYDAANRLTYLAEPGGSCPATPTFPNSTGCTGFGYDNDNQRTRTTYPNDFENTTTYDNAGRIAKITGKNSAGSQLASRTYAYMTDPAGGDLDLRKSVTDNSGVITTYGYDSSSRLASATRSGVTESWTYDVNGNRTTAAKTSTATTYAAYNAANQLCWTGSASGSCTTAPSGARTFSYDANGNQTASSASGTTAFNVYNQLTGSTTNGTTTPYAYAGTRNDERTSVGSTSFLTGLIGLTQETTGTTTKTYIREPNGALIGMKTGGLSYYYTYDAIGSVIRLSPSDNSTGTTYTYDSWGNTTASSGSMATVNPWRYAGGYYDVATNLTKFGARYYDSTIGRFTQLDPSGQSPHYTYASNDPINRVDPTGLLDWGNILEECAKNALEGGILGLALSGLTGGFAGIAANLLEGCAQGALVEVIAQAGGDELANALTVWFKYEDAVDIAQVILNIAATYL